MKIRAIALIALMSIISAGVLAQSKPEVSDTITVVKNAHSVLVTKSPSSNKITITGQGDNDDFYYSYSSEKISADDSADNNEQEWGLSLPFLRENRNRYVKSEVSWFSHAQIGICMPTDGPQGLDQSIDLAIGKLVGLNYTPWYQGPTFSLGVGVFWQKFALHGGKMFGMDGKSLVIAALPEGAHDTHVRLFNFGFQMPLTITQNLYRGFKVSAGVVMKLNSYTTASNKYTIEGRSYEQSFKGLQQRILTYDIFGGIGWDDFGLYCRYSPVAMFKSGNGPQFDVVSFGVNFDF